MLLVLGASHHDLELTHLERLSADADGLWAALVALCRRPESPVAGAVLLATCNRLEIYADGIRFHDAIDAITEALSAASGVPAEDVSASLKVRVGAPVAAHLFAVTSGLDSMVVGEAEIAGQVARAFEQAQRDEVASPSVHLLFQSAARTAKRVASATGLGAAGRSVASVALDIATAGTPGLDGSRVLVVGTGAYARVVAAELRARGCPAGPCSRPPAAPRPSRAGTVPSWWNRTCSVRPWRPPISWSRAAAIPRACSPRRCCPPRSRSGTGRCRSSISRCARDVPSGGAVGAGGPGHRPAHGVRPGRPDAPRGASPRRRTSSSTASRSSRTGWPSVAWTRRLSPCGNTSRAAVEKEMGRIRAKYPADVAADVELALHRVTQSLLHTPTLRAKEVARTGETAGYLQALHTVFGIDLSHADSSPHSAEQNRPA